MSEDKYKWRKGIILTKKEGSTIEGIIARNGCNNISQFVKKIAHGEPVDVPLNAISMPEMDDVQTHIVAEAIAKTNSTDILDLCRKISDGQIAIIIR